MGAWAKARWSVFSKVGFPGCRGMVTFSPGSLPLARPAVHDSVVESEKHLLATGVIVEV